jgi:hypothetical protein
MRAVGKWLGAISVIATFAAGCASDDGSDGGRRPFERQGDSNGTPVSAECSRRIDDQITAGEIPNADREYFIGMCEAFR